MAYKPILFSTPMIQSLLAGRKNMTRRLMKPQPPEGFSFSGIISSDVLAANNHARFSKGDSLTVFDVRPKYLVEDILWARERWRIVHINHKMKSGSFFTIQFADYSVVDYSEYIESAQEDLCDKFYSKSYEISNTDIAFGKWKPSIFMPREAARIFLEVTDVKCERVCDISEEDAIAEGIYEINPDNKNGYRFYNYMTRSGIKGYTAIESFKSLWESINGADTWDHWCFAYTFKQVSKPVNF